MQLVDLVPFSDIALMVALGSSERKQKKKLNMCINN